MPTLENVITGDRKKSIASWAKAKRISPDFAKLMHESLEAPINFLFNMSMMESKFKKLPKKVKDEIRNALLRVQIWCSINSHKDPIMGEKQLFISQVMEKLFFSGNLLSEDEDDTKTE